MGMKFFPLAVILLGLVFAARGEEPTNILSAETVVTFRVDMGNAARADGTSFSPFFEGVWVNGNFAGWWPWGSSPIAYQMADDGQRGDESFGDGIYTLQVTLPAGSSSVLEYNYGIESLDNEGGATNRTRVVKETGEFMLPLDVFGQIVRETGGGPAAEVGEIAIRKAANGNVTLSWEGGAGIRVQQSPSLATPAWSDLPGTLGASTVTVPASQPRWFFRLYRP